MSNSRKRRFLALRHFSSRHVQVQTKRLPSSPPRLLCLSPGQGPSVSSLSCPKPPLSWVMKPTLAHTTALTASYTPVSPTDTAGTHSHFTHAQAQPHQSTALIRMGKGYHLVTQVASGSPLHSAPLQLSRALATTARRRQALRSVWWTCCRHGRRAHAAHTIARHRGRSSRSWRRV